ncbi:MAG: cation acetate symporter, partial [Actinomycetota bacterium]|nr:cation acetate symporter [Actinomycetota bacterium]
LKLTALAVPAIFALIVWQSGGIGSLTGAQQPTFEAPTDVRIDTTVTVVVADPLSLDAVGRVDGAEIDGPLRWAAGEHEVAAGTVLAFPADAEVPHVSGLPALSGRAWAAPLGSGGGSPDHPVFATYSLILATFLGTMGLPHVLVRFYTNPDGRAARRTTLIVLALLGVFYLFPTLYGALGRLYVPQLLITGQTDAVVLLLPGAALGGVVGQILGALVAGGAFAAFLSTASGLLVSVSGVLSTDVIGRGTVRDFRRAAAVAGLVPLLIATQIDRLDVSQVVGLAFAVAASTFCPLLVLGIWWRGLTAVGALTGVLAGGALSLTAVLITVFGGELDGWPGVLLAQPAAWTVPVAFAVMVAVSRLTASRVPPNIGRTMLLLHAPESLGLTRSTPG